MMKKVLLLIVFMSMAGFVFSQADTLGLIKGEISYKSSQNIYVRFDSTTGIGEGDTLYMQRSGELIPALQVENLSSISCVCRPMGEMEFEVGEKIFAKSSFSDLHVPGKDSSEGYASEKNEILEIPEEDSITEEEETAGPRQDIYGRISVASYSNFSNEDAANNQRLRYRFQLNAKNMSGSKLSFESYVSFSHSNKDWEEIQNNVFEGLKIYNLNLNYAFNEDMQLWFGRKINPRISSLGAIDGLQFEKTFNSITAGVIAGSRPDYTDYSFNTGLFQAGAYFSHQKRLENGFIQSSLAFVEQMNQWNTDRRFLYFQHSNRLIKNLYFFGSGEVDLYRKVNDQKESTFNLSNLYLSLRYRMFRQLSLSLSYSARDNLIYYESYDKTFIEKLLETESMQGFRLAANYRPFKNISIGARAGYRYRGDDARPSRNLYTYIYFSRIPLLNMAATVNATFLESSYIKGTIYGARLSKNLLKRKLFAGLGYRNVDYGFYDYETSIAQHILQADINWRILQKLFLSVNYEATLEDEVTFHRLYLSLTQRF